MQLDHRSPVLFVTGVWGTRWVSWQKSEGRITCPWQVPGRFTKSLDTCRMFATLIGSMFQFNSIHFIVL